MTATEAAHFGGVYFEQRFPASMSGIILVDHQGRFAASQTAPKMAHAWLDDAGEVHASVRSNRVG